MGKKMTDPQSEHEADETERVFVATRWQTKIAIYYFCACLNLLVAVLDFFFSSVSFFPHPLVSIIFALPLLGLGAFYHSLQRFNCITISSDGLKWRFNEVLWQDIKSICESNRNYLSLEVETTSKKFSFPIAGTEDLGELRAILSIKTKSRQLNLPIEASGWKTCFVEVASLATDTLIGLTVIYLIRHSTPLVIPQEHFLIPGITYLAFSAAAGTAFKMATSRAFLLDSVRLEESLIQHREWFQRKVTIPFSTVTSLEASAPDPYYGEGLLIKAGTHQILLDSHFPNYPQVVEEICRRTGLEVQDA